MRVSCGGGGQISRLNHGLPAPDPGIDPGAAEFALRRGLVERNGDDIDSELTGADVTVVATPVQEITSLLARVGNRLKPGCVITDVGSTKRTIVDARSGLPKSVRGVGDRGISTSAVRQSSLAEIEYAVMTVSRPQQPTGWQVKPGRFKLRLGVIGALLASVAPLATWACRSEGPQTQATGEEQAAEALVRAGAFAYAGARLYTIRDGVTKVLAALPGGGQAPDTLDECAPSIPNLGAARFRELVPSPDPNWTAWETAGAGACVGVAARAAGSVQMLGHWAGAVPDKVMWAPAGRFLAVWLTHPGQRRSLELFDAETAERLEMPWEAECGLSGGCDVSRASWVGGTLLNVDIRLGPAEQPVPFEVNVAAATPTGQVEEI